MEEKQVSCVICFQTFNDIFDSNNYLDLSTTDCESKTYLDKIKYITNSEFIVYGGSLICITCTEELNAACKFKEKALQALDYWNNNFSVNLKDENLDDFEKSIIDYLENNCLDINNEVIQNEQNQQNTVPEEGTNFLCDKCKQSFTVASEYLQHICTDYANPKKEVIPNVTKCKENGVYKCDVCDKSFKKNWQLTRHYKVWHLNLKKYVCSYCNRAFKQLYHLQEHITSHTGERKFKCDICNKSFCRISSQRKHMKAHDAAPGEKSKKSPFLCSICGKKFPYSNGAQRHMRTHTDERLYECKICGNKFSQTSHLTVHLRTHTGEKPYPCKLCAESFSLSANLRKHMKNHKKPENVKIFHNLEPNLSEQNGGFEFEDSQGDSSGDFIERELPFTFVEGAF